MRSSRVTRRPALTRLGAALVCCLLGAFASGCKSNCRLLSEKACECSVNTYARDLCLRTVSANEASSQLTADDERLCGSLLERCDCRLVQTTEGKIACGLAWPPDAPAAADGG